jgi:hypothetical protein
VEEAAECAGAFGIFDEVGTGVDGIELDVDFAGFEFQDAGGVGGEEGPTTC